MFCRDGHGVPWTAERLHQLITSQIMQDTHQYVRRQHIYAPHTTPLPIRRHLPLFLHNIVRLGDTSNRIREELAGGRVPIESEKGTHAGVEYECRQIGISA